MKKLIIASILTIGSIARAENLKGFDYLGISHPKWDCSASIEALPERVALGTLNESFGLGRGCIEEAYRSGKVIAHRVHLLNGTCVTNKVCHKGETLNGYTVESLERAALKKEPKLVNFVVSECRSYQELAIRYGIQLYCSPVLEHLLTPKAFANLAEPLRAISDVTIVNSPRASHRVDDKYLVERHGVKARAKIISLDGDSAERVDTKSFIKRNENSLMTFLWSETFNGRREGSFVPIPKRDNFPTPQKFKEIADYFDPNRDPIEQNIIATCGATRFDGKKDETGGLVLLSKNSGGYKVVTPKKCGQFKHVTLIAKDGKKVRAKFSGLANGDRAHYNAPRGYNKMPKAFVINRYEVILPTRCAKLDRCE